MGLDVANVLIVGVNGGLLEELTPTTYVMNPLYDGIVGVCPCVWSRQVCPSKLMLPIPKSPSGLFRSTVHRSSHLWVKILATESAHVLVKMWASISATLWVRL